MPKRIQLLYHALFVGLITALVILVCGALHIKAWVAFFAWANYFLHGCSFKRSMKMLLAFIIGIFLALAASMFITHFNQSVEESYKLFVQAGVIFIVASFLVYLEFIEHWESFVPASFLGTVLFFASGVELSSIASELLPSLCIGIIAGLCTILGRKEIDRLLSRKA